MKKRLFTLLTLGILVFSFTACSKTPEAYTPVEKTETNTNQDNDTNLESKEEKKENSVEENKDSNADSNPIVEQPMVKLATTDYGTAIANVDVIKNAIENKDAFYLYIQGDDELGFDYQATQDAIKTITEEYGVPVLFYSINESDLLNGGINPIAAYIGDGQSVAELKNVGIEKEEDKITEDLGKTLYGFYAFKDGVLVNDYDNMVLPEEDASKLTSKITSFIYESDLFVDNHGLDIITYEEVLDKIEKNEKFILYVGRDTCPYCHAFMPSLTSVLDKNELNVPLYYLYTQSYKTAINKNTDGAQEVWDNLKETLGIQYTPSLVIFENGENVEMFSGYIVGADYWDADDEGKANQREEVTKTLDTWFQEKGFVNQ